MRLLSLFLGLVLSFSTLAAIDTYQFASPQQ